MGDPSELPDPGDPITVHVLLPCFNEQDSIISMAEALAQAFAREVDFRVTAVFIDDGSHDDTWSQIQKAQDLALPIDVGGIRLDHNQGKAAAQAVAIREVASTRGLVVLMDSDGQHDPTQLPAALRSCVQTGLPYIARRTEYRRSLTSRIGTAALSIILRLSSVRFDPTLGEYLVLPSHTVRLLARNPQLGVVPVVPLVQSSNRHVGTFDSPVLERSDGSGSTRWSRRQLWHKAVLLILANPWDMLPRVAMLIALTVVILGFYGLAAGIMSIIQGTFVGVGSIIVGMVIMFSVLAALQIVTLGLVVVLFRTGTQDPTVNGVDVEFLSWRDRHE